MRRLRYRSGLGFALKAALSGLLLVSLLLAAVLAATPLLHRQVHDCAADAHHACLVCAIAHGQMVSVDPAPPVAFVPSRVADTFRPANRSRSTHFEYRLSPSRAPPHS